MQEYMLLIRNRIDHQAAWTPEQHLKFLDRCREYIGRLSNEGKLLSAQPMVKDGRLLSGSPEAWKVEPFNESKEVIVGYYHILAKDLDDAIATAQGNPEFEVSTAARIEIRPIKTKEEATGYVYPQRAD